VTTPRTFRFVLIKPSRYDDTGYVIQWYRSVVPSNTLALMNGLTLDCARRRVLGDDVTISVETYDETNTVIPINQIIREIKEAGSGMVGLVGVQTNQFPRAMDLAAAFRAAEISVVIGGFHVSGCLAMLPETPPEIQEALNKGITIFAGEAEEHLDELLRDAFEGKLKPVYNFLQDLPSLEGAPMPSLPYTKVRNNFGAYSSFDAGRGCPFQCSFCTIINVQGRKSRRRTPDDIAGLIRASYPGIRRFFITDDDFARNKDWEPIFDKLIELREKEGLDVSFTIQVDTQCHRIPRFIEKAKRAGVHNVFIGLENIHPESLVGAKKRQNRIWEYRSMLLAWKEPPSCQTYVGYILGFPNDTPESIARDIEVIKKELPIDLLEFFFLTPLPGCEDHRNLHSRGVWMDSDLNKYDLEHVTTAHPQMSKMEWEAAYHQAWRRYFSWDHIETVFRREAATSQRMSRTMMALFFFTGFVTIEGLHPLQGGLFRRKVRTSRRSGMPLEHPLIFYPREGWEFLSKTVRWALLLWKLDRLRNRIKADPHRREYKDLAITPVVDEENEPLTLTKHIPMVSHASNATATQHQTVS
jgi:radical SAM superfamily enzyme YgiQ (UPF0313 family)